MVGRSSCSSHCCARLVLQMIFLGKRLNIDLDFGISEFLQNFFFFYLFIDHGSIIFDGELLIIIKMKLEIDLSFFDFIHLFLIVKLLKIRMFQNFFDSDSFTRIKFEHFRNQVDEFWIVHWNHLLTIRLPLHI